MIFSEVLESLRQRNYQLRPAGFFNVEGGDAAVATDYFEWCEACLEQLGPATSKCSECGRAPGNFIRVPSGDGDGVYVAFEVFNSASPNQIAGALVVFDNNYEIANSVRDPVLEEQIPEPPLALFEKHGRYQLVNLDELGPTHRLLISDGNAGLDSNYASIDVIFDPIEKLKVFALIEQISRNVHDEANRLSREAGMDRKSVIDMLESMVETAQNFGDLPRGFGALPNLLFRGLLITTETLETNPDLQVDQVSLDWEELTGQFLGKICTSHQQTMEAAAVWFNVLLRREVDRAAGEVSPEQAKRLLFDMWTWVYQGIHNGDEDCLPLLENSYLPTREEVVELLLRRGLKEASANFLRTGKIGATLIPLAAGAATLGTNHLSGGGQMSKSGEPFVAKFCGECGNKFESNQAKFCSECGSRR